MQLPLLRKPQRQQQSLQQWVRTALQRRSKLYRSLKRLQPRSQRQQSIPLHLCLLRLRLHKLQSRRTHQQGLPWRKVGMLSPQHCCQMLLARAMF
jgi:hypothetical protein